MKYSEANLSEIVESNIAEWSRRSRSESLLNKGKGCFIWDHETDGPLQSSGIFFTSEMLPNHFKREMANKLQKIIKEANHEKEIVVALLFEGRGMVGLLPKLENKSRTEIFLRLINDLSGGCVLSRKLMRSKPDSSTLAFLLKSRLGADVLV